ncbi:DUF4123 domain-containing protein [Luteimonas sp. MHLX1A]|uniref:DUF4123 domain-containing protein n=1 Tax=Alterluteimonas muca TaxID=2878684 RepID=UPI001E3BE961|nr:DUF4123 domain-containing protein [Luteimonas sp. MHLX1A]MCD9046522.1 DUF4123 domain-containing protein [Luteimonas sp. MHLX1A]
MTLERLDDLGHRELRGFDFALINPLRVPDARASGLRTVPLSNSAFKAQLHLCPLLLPLARTDDDGIVRLLERNDEQIKETGQPLFCALLASDEQSEALAARLGSRMVLAIPDGRNVWLRFHDPRIFSALSWWLDAEQVACLLGHIRVWAWYEPRDARWHQLDRRSEPREQRLKLSAEQWARLDRQPLVNRSLKALDIRPPFEEPLRSLVERIDEHLCRAISSGLTEDADLSLFAARTERHGEAWIRHPVAADALRTAIERSRTLAEGLKDLGDSGIERWISAAAGHMEEHA